MTATTASDARTPLFGSLIIAFAASLFGLLGLLSRTAYDHGLTPFAFVAWRAGIGATAVVAFLLLVTRRRGRLIGWRDAPRRAWAALGVAALMGAILNISMFIAFQRTAIAVVLLGFYLYPALVAAASAAFGWEPLDRMRVVALVIALVGMVLVVAGGTALGGNLPLDALGIALSLGAALSQAVFVLVSRHGYPEVPTEQAMATVLIVAAVVAGLISLVTEGWRVLAAPIDATTLLGLMLFTGLFGAAIPSSLFLTGIRRIGAIQAGILMLVEPLVGVALAAAFLREPIGPVQALGGAAILAAGLLIHRSRPVEATLVPAAYTEPPHAHGAGAGSVATVADPEGAHE